MPLDYARRLTGRERTAEGNARLGHVLAFVAGATNAVGFLAVQQYTSHMTGIVSAMTDHLALGDDDVVLAGLGGLLCFLLGAMTSAVMVNFARRRRLSSEFALRCGSRPRCWSASASRARACSASRGCSCRPPSCCCASSWAGRTR